MNTAGLSETTEGIRAPGWWGMALFCATEAMLFACLIASYFFLRSSVTAFYHEGGMYPTLIYPTIMTMLLLASSGFMRWGEQGIKAGDRRRLQIGLLVAFVLALGFLSVQAVEYSLKSARPQTAAYDSVFYTTTTLHGLHVALAILMNAVIQLRSWRGDFTARRYLAVQNVSLYWHFVDGVWIVIYTSLYVSPRWW